jgi:hypothetical protein
MIGIIDVACLAARVGAVPVAKMTSTPRRTNSAAISANRALRPSAHDTLSRWYDPRSSQVRASALDDRKVRDRLAHGFDRGRSLGVVRGIVHADCASQCPFAEAERTNPGSFQQSRAWTIEAVFVLA